jgi:exo-beta-1,3-glucanase (GH17 family)
MTTESQQAVQTVTLMSADRTIGSNLVYHSRRTTTGLDRNPVRIEKTFNDRKKQKEMIVAVDRMTGNSLVYRSRRTTIAQAGNYVRIEKIIIDRKKQKEMIVTKETGFKSKNATTKATSNDLNVNNVRK